MLNKLHKNQQAQKMLLIHTIVNKAIFMIFLSIFLRILNVQAYYFKPYIWSEIHKIMRDLYHKLIDFFYVQVYVRLLLSHKFLLIKSLLNFLTSFQASQIAYYLITIYTFLYYFSIDIIEYLMLL